MGRYAREHRGHIGTESLSALQSFPGDVGDIEKRRVGAKYLQNVQTNAQGVRLCAQDVDNAERIFQFALVLVGHEKNARQENVYHEAIQRCHGSRHKVVQKCGKNTTNRKLYSTRVY